MLNWVKTHVNDNYEEKKIEIETFAQIFYGLFMDIYIYTSRQISNLNINEQKKSISRI